MVPKRAPFTVLGVVVFRIYPPRIPIFGYPPPKGVRRTLHRECFQYPGSVRVDLKVDEGGGGVLFRKKRGGRGGICQSHPPITTVSWCPSKLIARPRVAPLPLRVTSSGAATVTRHARFSRAR